MSSSAGNAALLITSPARAASPQPRSGKSHGSAAAGAHAASGDERHVQKLPASEGHLAARSGGQNEPPKTSTGAFPIDMASKKVGDLSLDENNTHSNAAAMVADNVPKREAGSSGRQHDSGHESDDMAVDDSDTAGGVYDVPVTAISVSTGKTFVHATHGSGASPITSVVAGADSQHSMPPPFLHPTMPLQAGLVKTVVLDVPLPASPLLGPLHSNDSGKKCLVLDLDETLVHSTFQPVSNADLVIPIVMGDGSLQRIYVCKRPGVDEFMEQVGQLFEVVIFTASLASYADPVIDFLDLTRTIKYRLYRESCVQLQGLYIKDLGRLGRDVKHVAIVDNSPASYLLHPENAIAIKSWFSDREDQELPKLIPSLHQLAQTTDVYAWRQSYLQPHGMGKHDNAGYKSGSRCPNDNDMNSSHFASHQGHLHIDDSRRVPNE